MKRDDPEAFYPSSKKYYLVGTASKTSLDTRKQEQYSSLLVLKTLFTLTNQPEMKFTSKMT